MNSKRIFPVFLLAAAGFFFNLDAKNIEASFEESLELRRIVEYWKEKDYNTAKIQIRDFLNKNPQSPFIDQLYAMLGDVHFNENQFKEALEAYEKIHSQEFRQKSAFQRLHCLYETGNLEALISSAPLFLKDPLSRSQEIYTVRFELAEAYFLKAHAPENENKKKDLLKAALFEYQQLMQTKFSDLTLLPQAQIYAYLEDSAKAASLYLLLASKEPAKKEEYLFQAASQMLHKDKKSAIDTFASIVDLQGKYASHAAFNQLNLLYQEKRYRDFILAQDKALKFIPQEKLPLIQYYLGKSFVQSGDPARAIDPLIHSLSSKSLDRVQEKNALLSLILCAKETQDFSLFEKVLAHLKREFTNDEETASIILMHAQICRDKKEWAKARADIQELLEIYPQYTKRETLTYDQALLLSQDEKWQEAASAFEAFIQEFPQSTNKTNALRHVVSCRLEDVRHASNETQRIKKQLLLQALSQALDDHKTFSAKERQKVRYLQGKIYFELDQYDEAIGEFSEYARDFQKDPTCADAYLLLSYSYLKGSRDEIHFALNAERALSLNPQLQGAIDLHLTLYNTYLSLAEKASVDEKKELIEKAADHLFLAIDKPISKDNQSWLAGYYFREFQKGKQTALTRAIAVLEKSLDWVAASNELLIEPQTLEMEGEVIKLADMYAKAGRLKEQAKLFEALLSQYQKHPEYHWKYQRMASFELGKTYLALDEKENALQTFENLISSSSHASSYFAIASQLEKVKLRYAMLGDLEKNENSKTVQMLCDTLKEIQIQRKLYSEPLHLEAALCYVEIKSDFLPEGQKKNRKRFLLEQIKQSYLSQDDPLVSQYFSAASQFPEKERLVRQYLEYVDAEILRLQAEVIRDPLLLNASKNSLDKLMKETHDEHLKKRILKTGLYTSVVEKV